MNSSSDDQVGPEFEQSPNEASEVTPGPITPDGVNGEDSRHDEQVPPAAPTDHLISEVDRSAVGIAAGLSTAAAAGIAVVSAIGAPMAIPISIGAVALSAAITRAVTAYNKRKQDTDRQDSE